MNLNYRRLSSLRSVVTPNRLATVGVLAGIGVLFALIQRRTLRLEEKLDALAAELQNSRPAVARTILPMPELGPAPTDEEKLEQSLRESFPASDAPSISHTT